MLHLITRRGSADGSSDAKESVTRTHDGEINLSGSMTRQMEQDHPVQDATSHVQNVGRMVEDMEIKMRNLLQEVYFGKTRDVVNDLRSLDDLEKTRRQRELQKELVGFIKS
jgi:capping protein beta